VSFRKEEREGRYGRHAFLGRKVVQCPGKKIRVPIGIGEKEIVREEKEKNINVSSTSWRGNCRVSQKQLPGGEEERQKRGESKSLFR